MTDYDSVWHLTFNTQMKLALPLGSETESHEEQILCF